MELTDGLWTKTCALVGDKEDKLQSKPAENDSEHSFHYQTPNVRIRRMQLKVDQSADSQG